MDRFVGRWLKLVLAFHMAILLVGCSNLTGLFFYPQQKYLRTPTDLNLSYENVKVVTEDGTDIYSWFLPAVETSTRLKEDTSASPIVLFLHGNAENISTHIGSVYWLPSEGVNVFLLDYRGFGHSKGSPFIPAIFQDVEASLIWLRQRFPERRIYILGQSMGAAIATTTMAMFKDKYDISGLILDASLLGYKNIAQNVLGRSPITWIAWPLTWMLPTQWDPVNFIAQVSPKPIIMFHSKDDTVLPYASGLKLYEQAHEPKAWYETKGGHIQSFNFIEYRDVVVAFLHLENYEK